MPESRRRAVSELERRLALEPDSADAHGMLGGALLELARAVQAYAMAGAEDRSAEARNLYLRALEHFAASGRLRPGGSAQASRLRGVTLLELGDAAAAHRELAEARRLDANDAQIAADYAFSLQALGDTQGALAAYEKALREHPDDARLHAGLALSLLGAGEFARGWDEYEWRLKVPDAGVGREFPFSRWRGENLAGRTLLVSSEQGLGDEIMFASCFGELVQRAGLCVFEVSRRLASLFRRSFPLARVVERNLSRPIDWSGLPRIDFHIPAGSLPRLLRRQAGDFPGTTGYLRADPEKTRRWHDSLAALGSGLKVGLAWTGGLPHTLRAARSLPLASLSPLLATSHARFIALEFIDPRGELDALDTTLRPAWWPEVARDPDEAAALVSALDLVISVTTTTAHLSGALGKPTWILVPGVPTWRYLWEGEIIPWYPSARVLRRPAQVTLATFVESVAQKLRQIAR